MVAIGDIRYYAFLLESVFYEPANAGIFIEKVTLWISNK
jgi:hypothetical protein